MKLKLIMSTLFLSIYSVAQAVDTEPISVGNLSEKTVYAAVYTKKSGEHPQRFGELYTITFGGEAQIQRPVRGWFAPKNELYFSYDAQDFPSGSGQILPSNQMIRNKQFTHIDKGTSFFIFEAGIAGRKNWTPGGKYLVADNKRP